MQSYNYYMTAVPIDLSDDVTIINQDLRSIVRVIPG